VYIITQMGENVKHSYMRTKHEHYVLLWSVSISFISSLL